LSVLDCMLDGAVKCCKVLVLVHFVFTFSMLLGNDYFTVTLSNIEKDVKIEFVTVTQYTVNLCIFIRVLTGA